jgi:hypothetical protein
MAYTDPSLVTYLFANDDGTRWDFDATAGILACNAAFRTASATESAALDCIHCPTGASIQGVGVLVTETISAFSVARFVFAIKTCANFGATAATALTVTVPAGDDAVQQPGTAAAPGTIYPSPSATTWATLSATNAPRIVVPEIATTANVPQRTKVLPISVLPGGNFYVESLTASQSSTGAGFIYVVVRHNGGVSPINSLSPTVKAYSVS